MAKNKSRGNNGIKSKRKEYHGASSGENSKTSLSSKPKSGYHLDDANVKIGFSMSLVAVLASIVWKYMLMQKNDVIVLNQHNVNLDSSLRSLVHLACQNSSCKKDMLHVEDRTLFSGRRLEKNWKLLEIPRDMQIWTLDAFRDQFVKTNLIGARHSKTNEFLVEQAFLAAYLAMLVKRNVATQNPFSDDRNHTTSSIYLENLPTYEDYKSHHPVTFGLKELDSLYGAHTHTYFLVSKRKEEIESEYKTFARVSSEFGNFVSYQDYVAARLNVQARAFEAGPLSDQDAPLKELEWYKKNFGIDIREKVTAMVPILDAFNSHHKERNVHYKYVPESKKYLAYASKNIKKGAELFDTYGERAE